MDYLTARAQLALANGQDEEALAHSMAAIELSNHYGIETFVATRSAAALALVSLGRADEARELASEELGMAERAGNHRVAAIASRALALATDDLDGRLDLLHHSVGEAKASPARLDQARSLVELGAALRHARRRRESREPLREGLELARHCGSLVLAERAETELEATGAQVPDRPRSGLDALTPSELRVAELAGTGGLSNREIAERLFITRRTVETHLTSVYRKLGVEGREALTGTLSGV